MNNKFTTTKIWRTTLKLLRLISAHSGNSVAKEVDDFAKRRLKELESERGDSTSHCPECGTWFSLGQDCQLCGRSAAITSYQGNETPVKRQRK